MRKVLIVKLGSTFPALAARVGDFEDWIQRRLGLDGRNVAVVNPPAGEALPDPRGLAGAVISGSHAMVSDHEPWSERTGEWLRGAVEAGTAVLGICYGHQLLAQALGGRVARNPRGREYGTIEVALRPEAADDPLFGGLPERLAAQASHYESVLELPGGAAWLASSAKDPHHAFRAGERAWGVQFHPEFDDKVLRAYIRHNAHKLRDEGLDPQELLQTTRPSPAAEGILGRFGRIAGERLEGPQGSEG